ncbi:mucin-like protein [Cordyceps javanica]|uniref:Mucin-like protein n=1 Tax=Cordyceps javanica TaxID=43265 RepID=A0A545V9N7_9HYPO|nr:mucin-like protein [Cordyceps javanica]TQW09658.1 mucin-like protein [Cordyceps javanica]
MANNRDDGDDTFHDFGTRPAGTIATITSDNCSDNCSGSGSSGSSSSSSRDGINYSRGAAGRSNRYSLMPFRHVSSSSEDDGSYRHGGRFHQGLKLLDRTTARTRTRTRGRSTASVGEGWRGHRHVRSQASQGSGSGTDAQSPSETTSFPAMTKEEFEALPPTIQRKYFSTLERLRFAQDPDPEDSDATPSASFDNLPKLHPNINPATSANTATTPSTTAASTSRSFQDNHWPVRLTVLSQLPSETGSLASSLPRRPRSALVRLYSSPALDRLTTSTKLGAGIVHKPDNYHPSTLTSSRHSVILDAIDEALIKRGKRHAHARVHSHLTPRQSRGHLHRAASFDTLPRRMHPRTGDAAWMDGRLKETEDSLYDSFRWLEDDLDLRLDLDDYHVSLRDDVPDSKNRGSASFRRKLSISSKATFSRASSTLSRPTTKDGSTPFGGSVLSLQNSSGNGHIRRRSRALSLMSITKQPPLEVTTAASPPPAMDPAAHYQDPEARMKLRVYLASPHKFDEAVEFGFPSTEQQPQSPTTPPKRVDSLPRNVERGAQPRMQTVVEDRRCSLYSDETIATGPDSPRTPDTMEKPSAPFTAATDHNRETAKVDYAQAHAYSREMTLRMTLTRPDLRASENQMYGWQKNSPPSVSDGPRSPTGPMTEDDMKKDSIERQLAAIDQENLLYPEQSSMRRFWNRVRRT